MDKQDQALQALTTMRQYTSIPEKGPLQSLYLDLWEIGSHSAEFFIRDLIARLWPHYNKVGVTWRSGDGGKDVTVKCHSEDVFLEVKWWRANKVGKYELKRNWERVCEGDEDFEEFRVITLNAFTNGAYTYAEERNIELWNGIRLCAEVGNGAVDLVRDRVHHSPAPRVPVPQSHLDHALLEKWRRYNGLKRSPQSRIDRSLLEKWRHHSSLKGSSAVA